MASAADLIFTLGLDDAEFKRAIRTTESDVSRVAGRVGSAVEAQTAGARKLAGAISSTVGAVTGVLGAFTVIGGLLLAAGAAMGQLVDDSERLAASAEAEAKARREIADVVSGARLQGALALGGATEFDARRSAVDREANAQIDALERATQEALDAARAAGASTNQTESIRDDLRRGRGEIEAARRARQTAIENDEIRAGIDLLRKRRAEEAGLGGDKAGSERILEEQRRQERLREVDVLTAQGRREEAQELLEIAERTHARRLAMIDEEEAKRAQADRDAAAAEERRTDLAQEAADLRARELEAKLLAARGDEEGARRLQREIDLERELVRIRDMEGITEEQRGRLAGLAVELADTPERPDREEASARSIGAGVGPALVVAQAIGAGSAERSLGRVESATQDTAEHAGTIAAAVQQILGSLEGLGRRGAVLG